MLSPLASVVFFLFLLVSVRCQQCGRIRASERKYTNCTRAFSLDIVDTDLRSLDDFQWLESIDYNASDNLDPTAKYDVQLRIVDNEKLMYGGSFLPNLKHIQRRDQSLTASIVIRNNSRLCLPEEVRRRLMRLGGDQTEIQGCYCHVRSSKEDDGSITLNGLDGKEQCTTIYGAIIFHGNQRISEQMKKQFNSVEELFGMISLTSTNWTIFKLFSKLRRIRFHSTANRTHTIQIHDNPNLKNVYFESLETVIGQKGNEKVAMISDNPKLLLDDGVMSAWSKIHWFRESEKKNTNERLPFMDALYYQRPNCSWSSTLPEEFIKCVVFLGDVVVDNSTGTRVDAYESFAKVSAIYGCLTITNTSFQNLSFFAVLGKVVCEKNRPAVLIENNPELRLLELQLYSVTAKKGFPAVALRNNQRICSSETENLRVFLRIDSPSQVVEEVGSECFNEPRSFRIQWAFYGIAGLIIICGNIVMEAVQLRRDKR